MQFTENKWGYLEITVNTLETIVLPYVLIRSLNLNLADLIFVLVIGCFMLKSRSMRSGIVARSSIGKTSCNQSTELSKIESADLIKTKINDYIQWGAISWCHFCPRTRLQNVLFHCPSRTFQSIQFRWSWDSYAYRVHCPVDSNLN